MISRALFDKSVADIGLQLPERAFDLFDAYAEALTDYNEKVNLTAITAPDEVVIKHFIDSISLLRFVSLNDGAKICDVGTGAGFPGMCLAIARPDLQVTLFDSVNKKLEFLRILSMELAVPVEIVTIRAEDAGRKGEYREQFDLVTARAVSQLNVLSEYCVPLVKKNGLFAPMKAKLSEEEAQRGIGAAANLGAKLRRRELYALPNGSEREILIFEKINATSAKYPRNAAQISKKPL